MKSVKTVEKALKPLKNACPQSVRSGYTLMEVVVATALSTLLVLVVGALSVYSGRHLTSLGNYATLEAQSRATLDVMTREIRQSVDLVEFTPTKLTLLNESNQPIKYLFDSAQKKLLRIQGTEQKTMLNDCDYVSFSIYQRNITNGSYSQYRASSTNTAKLIELNWGCSRAVIGTHLNTESIQSAKVVIRKKRTETDSNPSAL